MEEFLSCLFCKGEMRDPRSLECMHSLCFSCLKEYASGCKDKISCLKCKKETSIPRNDISAITCHPLLAGLLEAQRNSDPKVAEYQKTLTEMKDNGITILSAAIMLTEFFSEKESTISLFFRKNGNVEEFKRASILFSKAASKFQAHTYRGSGGRNSEILVNFVAIDIEKYSQQPLIKNINENEILFWEHTSYKLIPQEKFESLLRVKNVAFMRYSFTAKPKILEITPSNRAIVSMCCPDYGCKTPDTRWIWHCFCCFALLEYDLSSDQIFCDCGVWDNAIPPNPYQARCGNASHPYSTIVHSQLRSTLKNLKKIRDINILVIGETGVGKTTWINAVANYVTSSNLTEAKTDANFRCLVEKDASSNIVDRYDEELHTSEGYSDTKIPSSYLIPSNKLNIRLIDTPGVGDTDGEEQDKEHCEDILHFLANSSFKELHGICILMNYNMTRIQPQYKYCLIELFKQLHVSAARNLIFCFTFASTSNLHDKDKKLKILNQLLSDVRSKVQISITAEEYRNAFFLDNSVFDYLLSVRNGKKDSQANFDSIWNHSKAETNRLFKYAELLTPYNINNSSSIYEARNLISTIINPTITLQQSLESNTKNMQNTLAKHKVNSKLKVGNQIYCEMDKDVTKPLGSRYSQCRTCPEIKVLNESKEKHEQQQHTIYKDCEKQKGILTYFYRRIFGKTLCPICGCSISCHEVVTYSKTTIKYYDRIDDIQKLQNDIDKNNEALSTITTTLAKFSYFLQHSAVAKYKDLVIEKLEFEERTKKERQLVEAKKKLGKFTVLLFNSTLFGDLEFQMTEDIKIVCKIKEKHVEELKKCEGTALTSDQILKLPDLLYEIPSIGKEIQNLVDIERKTRTEHLSKEETVIRRKQSGFSIYPSDYIPHIGLL